MPAYLATLRQCGVTHLIGLPDNDTAALFDELTTDNRPPVLVRVCREGEAFAVAAGLWVGGALPVVVIQNTGLLEAGDALRGTIIRMGIPLLCLVGYRGYRLSFDSNVKQRRRPPRTPANLRAPRYDSAALLTEPTLRAWHLPYRFLDDDPEQVIVASFQEAHRRSGPVALLLTKRLAPAEC